MADPYSSLRRGEIDVLCNWLILDEPDLVPGPRIDHRQRVLAVGRHHRLAAHSSVSIEALGDELAYATSAPSFPTALQEALRAQEDRRRDRMRRICAALTKAGLPGGELLTAVEANPGIPTRSHLAAALVAGGHVPRTEDAFRKYLGRGKRAHVAADWPSVEEVVALILKAGGVASMAHPARYALSSGARRRLVADFAQAGGSALEVVTGANGAQHAPGNAALAMRFGLRASVGSDFHDPQLAWNPLGRLAKLPDGIDPLWRDRFS